MSTQTFDSNPYLKLRFFANRVLNFVRPKPRKIPLKVDDILGSQGGRDVTEKFIDLYYGSGVARNLNWKGVEVLKNPCDLWMTIELMQQLEPSVIIETGTHFGGSASFFADITQTLGLKTRIVTIDYNPKWAFPPESKGIVSLVGYSTTPAIFEQAKSVVTKAVAENPGPVMVFLDSDHSTENVLNELKLYSPLVTVGSYIVVEDSIVNGHPSFPAHGPGPWEAAEAFLKINPDFEVDLECQRFLLTYNPNGWLKRLR